LTNKLYNYKRAIIHNRVYNEYDKLELECNMITEVGCKQKNIVVLYLVPYTLKSNIFVIKKITLNKKF